ncbi:hypothetical protein IE53DRAFT_391257 [Violaceomyces palustris]|uniref:Uncharacterized protein n=1 Tax=Violaceomyces palustris TaxID=1673888 RepID=A0ACD0NLB7_9BASI|nr:hypothetical protein IE53DRAFT_391257 [Violaceomyces palustris]
MEIKKRKSDQEILSDFRDLLAKESGSKELFRTWLERRRGGGGSLEKGVLDRIDGGGDWSKEEIKVIASFLSYRIRSREEEREGSKLHGGENDVRVPIRSDVTLPTALKTGKLGESSSKVGGRGGGDGATMASEAYLDRLEEGVNKTIDSEVEALLESFKELVSLATMHDKDKFRVAQEAFQAEARAEIMVRAAQSLSLLSEELKLSLLLSKTPSASLDDEAIELMRSTEMEKLRCARLLGEILGIGSVEGERLVEEVDDSGGPSDVAPDLVVQIGQQLGTSGKVEAPQEEATSGARETGDGPPEMVEEEEIEFEDVDVNMGDV